MQIDFKNEYNLKDADSGNALWAGNMIKSFDTITKDIRDYQQHILLQNFGSGGVGPSYSGMGFYNSFKGKAFIPLHSNDKDLNEYNIYRIEALFRVW